MKKKEKSAVIISYIYPFKDNPSKGIFVHQQAKYLAKEIRRVDVITTHTDQDIKEEKRDRVNIHRVSKFNSTNFFAGMIYSVRTLKKLKNLAKEKKFDFVIENFIGLNTLIFGIFLRIMGKKFIVISHGTGWELPSKNPFKNFIINITLRFPNKIVCVSRKTKELLIKNTDQKKLIVVNNGMDPEYLVPSKTKKQFKSGLGLDKDFVLLSVANLIEKKGIDIIIKAVYNIHKKYPNMKYIIVGEGPLREKLQNMIDELKLNSTVTLVGKKVGHELANYYNVCDLFVLMSKDVPGGIESFGIVYLEASYFGKPVIGGKSGGTKDAIIDGKTGYLVDSKNTKKLEETILLLLKNKKLRNKIGSAGRARVLKEFLWKHNVKKLLNIC